MKFGANLHKFEFKEEKAPRGWGWWPKEELLMSCEKIWKNFDKLEWAQSFWNFYKSLNWYEKSHYKCY